MILFLKSVVKDIGLICFIVIVLAIGLGLYRYFEKKEEQEWLNKNTHKSELKQWAPTFDENIFANLQKLEFKTIQ